ncbi:flagellar motor protein MotB [Ignavibacteria bacterium]|nr:OmpA family protein [Bacteroidota bacterium]MCZ2132932.1 OmpA family protein [Bacteroidota bacterium]
MLRKRREPENDHSSQDRYLITYSDLITLLLGLFVILYASAQVDTGKYKEFSMAMSEYFKPDSKSSPKSDRLLPGSEGIPQPILPRSTEKTLDQLQQETVRALDKQLAANTVEILRTPSHLRLRLSEKLLFLSGKADIQPAGAVILDSLAAILRGIPQDIVVEGYTDSIPIRTFQFESNFHLSAERALNVGYYLLQAGVPSESFSVQGFGETRPVAPNSTPDGRARNRRVEILLSSKSPEMPSDQGYIRDSTSAGAQR